MEMATKEVLGLGCGEVEEETGRECESLSN